MRWCFESAQHPYADSILQRLAGGEDAIVPVLWFYEASAVLAREEIREPDRTQGIRAHSRAPVA